MGDSNLRRKSLDPSKLRRNCDGNFRIHLQSTKAICRNRSLISTTDSLKLYEDQIIIKNPILNDIDEASLQKRPLSLCFDLGSSGEETNTTDTSSTISSVSSSSSSSTNSRSGCSNSSKGDYDNILEDEVCKNSKSNLCFDDTDADSEVYSFVSCECSAKESAVAIISNMLCNCRTTDSNVTSNSDCEDVFNSKDNYQNRKPLVEQSYDLKSPDDFEIHRNSALDNDSASISKSPDFEIPPKEILEIIKIFNLNSVGMRMFEDYNNKLLVCTLKIFVNLSDPVRMGSPTHFHNSSHVSDKTLFPRGGFELININRSTTCKDIIEHLFEKFHIQENYCKYALFEHTVKINEKDYLKRLGYEFSILGHLINMVRIEKQNFVGHLQCKRFVLQENEKTPINWSSFSISELSNFLRILEKEEKDRREKIVNFYSELRKMIESQIRVTFQ